MCLSFVIWAYVGKFHVLRSIPACRVLFGGKKNEWRGGKGGGGGWLCFFFPVYASIGNLHPRMLPKVDKLIPTRVYIWHILQSSLIIFVGESPDISFDLLGATCLHISLLTHSVPNTAHRTSNPLVFSLASLYRTTHSNPNLKSPSTLWQSDSSIQQACQLV